MSNEKRLMHLVRYDFDPKELREMGDELAREAGRMYELQSQKKTTTADLTAQFKVVEQRHYELQKKINQKHEYREMECIEVFDVPKKGHKQIVRADTGEIVEEDKLMTAAEMQREIEFRQ